MPRKRRKAIITETTPDIPFQKVRVEWVDCVSDSGWANEKESQLMYLPIYLIRELEWSGLTVSVTLAGLLIKNLIE